MPKNVEYILKNLNSLKGITATLLNESSYIDRIIKLELSEPADDNDILSIGALIGQGITLEL